MAGHAQLKFVMMECSDTNSLDGAHIVLDIKVFQYSHFGWHLFSLIVAIKCGSGVFNREGAFIIINMVFLPAMTGR